MNRTDFIRHIESHGCAFVREGARHTLYKNLATGAMSAIPRHRVIKKNLVPKICNDLGIPRP